MHKSVAFFCFFLLSACLMGQTVSFTYKSTTNSYCNPDTVQFTPTSTGSPIGYIWDFGNNRFSHSANPAVIYSSPGSYTVKLLVIYPQGTVEASNIVVINPTINPSFSYDKNNLCKPGIINFSATGAGAVSSYDWDFGDGTPISNTASRNISHLYAAYGNFEVTLTVNSAGGCISSSTAAITVQQPTIDATISATEGCIPAIINFNATVSVLPGDGISSYLWTFGDGTS
ncbi:MAG: PKD domain-containing protein, partial [Ginsengibacter sp.]